MALGNAYEMLSDFYKAHPEVLKKEIKGVKLMFIHAYPVGDCVMTKSAPILKLDDIKGKKLGFEGGGLRFETMQALGASVVGMNMSDHAGRHHRRYRHGFRSADFPALR